jgi:hypothetical protein
MIAAYQKPVPTKSFQNLNLLISTGTGSSMRAVITGITGIIFGERWNSWCPSERQHSGNIADHPEPKVREFRGKNLQIFTMYRYWCRQQEQC